MLSIATPAVGNPGQKSADPAEGAQWLPPIDPPQDLPPIAIKRLQLALEHWRGTLGSDLANGAASGADAFRYQMFARRLSGAEAGVPDAVQWAWQWFRDLFEADLREEAIRLQAEQEGLSSAQRRREQARADIRRGYAGNPRFQAYLNTLQDPEAELYGPEDQFHGWKFLCWASQNPGVTAFEVLRPAPTSAHLLNIHHIGPNVPQRPDRPEHGTIAGLLDALRRWDLEPWLDQSASPGLARHSQRRPYRGPACKAGPVEYLVVDGTLQRVTSDGDPLYPDHPNTVSYLGNFLQHSFGFRLDTDDPALISRLDAAIAHNQARPPMPQCRPAEADRPHDRWPSGERSNRGRSSPSNPNTIWAGDWVAIPDGQEVAAEVEARALVLWDGTTEQPALQIWRAEGEAELHVGAWLADDAQQHVAAPQAIASEALQRFIGAGGTFPAEPAGPEHHRQRA